MVNIETISKECRKRCVALEKQYSMASITKITESLPVRCIENAIKSYQGIIRGNLWYFPMLRDASVTDFLCRWNAVHASYFKMAEKIFGRLSESLSLSSLADPNLLEDVIRSETMRGWVGKRSLSGLDALLYSRVEQLEKLLKNHFDMETVDKLLSIGGVFRDPCLASAETEMVRLFQQYKKEYGDIRLTPDLLSQFTSEDVPVTLLREFCRCSISEFNKKLSLLKSRNLPETSKNDHDVDQLESYISKIPKDDHDHAMILFEEIRTLNYLNLNLEVKYSFKGWVGLMHIVVFIACSNATNVPINVYAMHTKLKNGDRL